MVELDTESNTADGTREKCQGSECAALSKQTAFLRLMGKAHMNEILREFALDSTPWRFHELEEQLEIAPSTLSDRLNELTDLGLLTRCSYDEVPPRIEYEATAKLNELAPVYNQLDLWIERHDF